MALFEDMLKGGGLTGIAVGLGAVMLAPALLPAIGKALRPAAKQVLKSGMVLYRNTLGELGEATSDLVAEVRGELQAEAAPEPAHAAAGASGHGRVEAERKR